MTKYKFTSEQTIELGLLRTFFDVMLAQVMPEVAELINTTRMLTPNEVAYMESGIMKFDELVLKSKHRNFFLIMVDLIELESKHTKQEFINNLLEQENYELLNTMKKMNHLKEF